MNTTLEQTNDLRFSTAKPVGKDIIHVKIKLNDECKNGHQDFSITGDIYKAGKPKIDRYLVSCGCIHEEISKYFPEFRPFIALHLCDLEGVPMHASANGFYHLRNGFNKTKPGSSEFKKEYCKYYRISGEQFDKLNAANNELQFSVLLEKLGILAQWKIEANEAIKKLEELTGKSFLVDSKKSNYHAPTPEQLAEEDKKQKEGYYTKEAKEKRELAKMLAIIDKMRQELDEKIKRYNTEFEIKKQVLKIGGVAAFNNCIFYTHSNELAFNWRNYDNISSELIDKIKAEIELPKGVTIK